MNKVQVACVQMSCGESVAANIEKTVGLAREAVKSGANIICLQELYTSQYFPQTVDVINYGHAKPLDDQALIVMQEIAKRDRVVMVVPIYEKAMDGVYFNSTVVFDAGGADLGKFRKIHIPDGPQYHEKYYFTPGDLGYPVFKTAFGTIGVGICWDEWFPEVARILALKGAQILFYPSAIGSEPDLPGYSSHNAWETVIRAHGICNNVFVAAVNRVGRERDMEFYGGSFISDPNGKILAQGNSDSDQVLMASVDYADIAKYRNLLQFHRDRRPETYAELMKQVLV